MALSHETLRDNCATLSGSQSEDMHRDQAGGRLL